MALSLYEYGFSIQEWHVFNHRTNTPYIPSQEEHNTSLQSSSFPPVDHDKVIRLVVDWVHERIEEDFHYQRVFLPFSAPCWPLLSSSSPPIINGELPFIYASNGVINPEQQKDTLVLLLPGRGPHNLCGVWDARGCVEENVLLNSQYSYLSKIFQRQWDVILLNPNQPHVFRGHNSNLPLQNVAYVWETAIESRPTPYKRIFVIAHTHGAQHITNILETYPHARLSITKLAFIDAHFRLVSDSVDEVLLNHGKSWVSSRSPLNTPPLYHPLTLIMPCVSAGQTHHTWEGCCASVFDFLEHTFEEEMNR
jgi:hypothetical protein